MTPSKIRMLLVLVCAATALTGALVPANPPAVAAWSDPPRHIQATATGPNLEVTSERVATTPDLPADVLRVRIAADAGRLSHRLENAAGLGGIGPWLNITWGAVTQFDDLDADGRYSIGDPVLKRFVLTEVSRSTWTIERSSDGSIIATVNYFLVEARSTVAVSLHLNAHPTLHSEETVPPTEAVVRVAITNFPVQEGATRPRLALETRIAGQPMLPAGAVLQRTDSIVQFVTWADAALVGGIAVSPGTTVEAYGPPAENQAVVVFSYPMNSSVSHALGAGVIKEAPRNIGAAIQEDVLGNWPLYVSGLAFAGMLIAVPMYRARLRRDRP
jgi:hypothetical protein